MRIFPSKILPRMLKVHWVYKLSWARIVKDKIFLIIKRPVCNQRGYICENWRTSRVWIIRDFRPNYHMSNYMIARILTKN